MKAIQVKFLSYTETLPMRFKAFTEAGSLTEPNEMGNPDAQVRALAKRYIQKMNWNVRISGSGVLPNGDWVFTLAPKRA